MKLALFFITFLSGCAASQTTPVASQPPPFKAAWWCSGPNQQTILSVALRPVRRLPLERRRWELPDGDFLDADWLPGPAGTPILIVLHGLEGSSDSRYVHSMLGAAQAEGWRGLGLNYRGCSGEPNRLPVSYHGGATADLAWVVNQIVKENPGAPIVLVGASLGANILVKYIGENGDRLPEAVKAGVAISTPFDLALSAHTLEQGSARFYMKRLVASMKLKAQAKLKKFPGYVDAGKLEAVKTLTEFDDLVTGPVHGFKDANDYWSHSSSVKFLGGVRRPVLLISSKDDPFFPGSALPAAEVSANRFLTADFTERGGHVGFLTGWVPGRAGSWIEGRALYFLKEQLQKQPSSR
jgi:predicted alpha/beta-fold hydrolase